MSGHMSQNLASIVPLSMNINDLSLHLHIQKISSISIQEVAENFMWKNFFFLAHWSQWSPMSVIN